ncbi:MAG: tetratricopeptide repeat protein [Candidatus Omnitrophica bacterium]|nr:tetratricopeptide repeat protein [Candidatus Omnitrophota bacterium]
MRAKVTILTLLCAVLFAASGLCGSVTQAKNIFYLGNVSYDKEDFKDAIAQYEEVLRTGYESGELYYNLGNAYFKNGSLGKAIVNYLKAKRFMPGDEDLRSNLSYARSLIREGVVSPKFSWFESLFLRVVDAFSLNGITLVTACVYFALSAVFILSILFKNLRPKINYAAASLALSLLLCIAIGISKFNGEVLEKKAVITAEAADSKFEPFEDATIFFRLNEGETVIIVDERDNWYKVKRPDGRQGWIKTEVAELL